MRSFAVVLCCSIMEALTKLRKRASELDEAAADTWCVVVRRALLSFAASFLDMTNVTFPEEKQGPAHRRAFRALMDAREELLSKL